MDNQFENLLDKMNEADGQEKKLPPHLQAIADKAKKDAATITDVTPEGYGPATNIGSKG